MKRKKNVPDSIKRNTYWGTAKYDEQPHDSNVKDLKTVCREEVLNAKRKATERIRKMELEKRAIKLETEKKVRKELCEKNGESHKKFLRNLLMESVHAEERRREILESTPKTQRKNLENLFAKDRKKEQALITRIYEDLSYFIYPERPIDAHREKKKNARCEKEGMLPMGL